MGKFLSNLLKKIAEMLETSEPQANLGAEEKTTVNESSPLKPKNIPSKKASKREIAIISDSERSIRDFTEMMENPFLALSKKRKTPIIYESQDGTRKIKVTRHTGHFIASIYDWDIILFVAGKMQEILNNGSDIPPRTMIIPIHEILKALHKDNGNKQQKDLVHSLERLQLTGIDTTIRNEDYKYRAGFGFLDSWGYAERKSNRDINKIHITISQWLYDGICAKGTLLKVSPAYFYLTSALKRFLYRTARKHVGNNKEAWEFTIEKLYDKSGSESELKVFKNKLKQAVLDNDIPDYFMQWAERKEKSIVIFKDKKSQKLEELLEQISGNQQNIIEGFEEETIH